MGGLASLQSLNLTDNQLSGDIPDELSSLGFLQSLNLTDNQLGCIPDSLRDVAVGELPVCTPEDHPGDTEALIALYNAWEQPGLENWLSREPIGEWEGVSVDSNGRVTALNLAGKGLSGEISPEVGRLESLQVLDLSDNALTGELPPELGSLESLRVLYLAEGNELTGGGKCVPNVAALSLPISALAPLGELCVTGGEFASVSAGGAHACGVKTDGSVACWGSNEHDQATPPAGEFASVSAWYAHTCGVQRDGSVACWGSNNYGMATPPEGKFASVSAGGSHTCGVRSDGSVACWGSNNYGMATPPEGKFASVSAVRSHTCGVRTDGSVACWGSVHGTPPAGEFASVSAGGSEHYGSHACGVRTDGSVACWGSFSY